MILVSVKMEDTLMVANVCVVATSVVLTVKSTLEEVSVCDILSHYLYR